jgi:type II secretory pathway pseudopilin PulG
MKAREREKGYSIVEILGVVSVAGIVSALALPAAGRTIADLSMRADARALSDSVMGARMRAAQSFTKSRVFVDFNANRSFVQIWNEATREWDTDGSVRSVSRGVTFGFGALSVPPPNTQTVIGQPPLCTDASGGSIGNSACIVFNSRGVPIDESGAPTGNNAIYITNGTGVYAATITATPLLRLWWSPAGAAAWVSQ